MRALVIGSGRNVAAELATLNRSDYNLVIGVNQAAIDYGPVDIHATLHAGIYGPRKAAYMVAPHWLKGVDEWCAWMWPGCRSSGSSGLYGIKVALKKGATDITLAGIGMDYEPHYYGSKPWAAEKRFAAFRETWEQVAPQLRGTVRSLGGWTKELLTV